jgi:hypothetical protein
MAVSTPLRRASIANVESARIALPRRSASYSPAAWRTLGQARDARPEAPPLSPTPGRRTGRVEAQRACLAPLGITRTRTVPAQSPSIAGRPANPDAVATVATRLASDGAPTTRPPSSRGASSGRPWRPAGAPRRRAADRPEESTRSARRRPAEGAARPTRGRGRASPLVATGRPAPAKPPTSAPRRTLGEPPPDPRSPRSGASAGGPRRCESPGGVGGCGRPTSAPSPAHVDARDAQPDGQADGRRPVADERQRMPVMMGVRRPCRC